MPHEITAERIHAHLMDLPYYTDTTDREAVTPYWRFSIDGDTYYLTSGGYLFRKEPGTEGVGGFFCGYFVDGVWHPRTDHE
jgi:hypothetical protein